MVAPCFINSQRTTGSCGKHRPVYSSNRLDIRKIPFCVTSSTALLPDNGILFQYVFAAESMEKVAPNIHWLVWLIYRPFERQLLGKVVLPLMADSSHRFRRV
jgi:hypothetical protein